MKKILLLSDTHSYIGSEIKTKALECDEIWHAGDWGDAKVDTFLTKLKPVRGVYGNIDGKDIRTSYPEFLVFECEKFKVAIQHIGGYPGRYAPGVKQKLEAVKPDIFISGHSHICKIVRDKTLNLLHFNPGAIGIHGFQKVRTMLMFTLDNGRIFDVKVIEYEKNTKYMDR